MLHLNNTSQHMRVVKRINTAPVHIKLGTNLAHRLGIKTNQFKLDSIEIVEFEYVLLIKL